MKLHSRSCPDMACIVYRSHSVTCTPMHLSANGINRSSLSLISQSWYSFTNPWGMEDWVVQTNRMASKQSAHDWYIVVGTAVNHSSRHVPLGPWRVSSLPTATTWSAVAWSRTRDISVTGLTPYMDAYYVLFIQWHSEAKNVGCFKRRVFGCLFICLWTR